MTDCLWRRGSAAILAAVSGIPPENRRVHEPFFEIGVSPL